MHRSMIALAAILLPSIALAAGPRVPQFIKPYPGAEPYGDVVTRDFDEVDFIVRKVTGEPPGPSFKRVAGKRTSLAYTIPDGRSTLEVYKNYEDALLEAGFEKIFSCAGEAQCGEGAEMRTWAGAARMFVAAEGRYLAARLEHPEGNVWVSVYVTPIGLALTGINIVQEKPMQAGMVKVDVAALKNALERDGHIAVYGIVFETNKAVLKPEASAALEEVKRLLVQNPALKLYVVGHTDDVGTESANMALSNARAAAVVQALTTKHGIAKNRLKAQGAGPYVPVASNRNEAGRAKNRRVELVEDLDL